MEKCLQIENFEVSLGSWFFVFLECFIQHFHSNQLEFGIWVYPYVEPTSFKSSEIWVHCLKYLIFSQNYHNFFSVCVLYLVQTLVRLYPYYIGFVSNYGQIWQYFYTLRHTMGGILNLSFVFNFSKYTCRTQQSMHILDRR